jgi:CRP-like cAMP-binding protein
MPREKRSTQPRVDAATIAGLPLFAGMSADAHAELARTCRPRRVPKGAALFEQGAVADTYFVVLDGRLRVVQTTPDGQQIVVRFVGHSEPAGVLAAFGVPAYPASAIAVADTLALAWEAKEAAELMKRYPAWAMTTSATIGGRVQEAHARVRELATERVERRIAHAVLRLARQGGRRVEEGVQIEFPLSRQDIAEMTGTTLHTVSRVMSAWEQAGIVEGGRQRIVIKDPHALVRIAEES